MKPNWPDGIAIAVGWISVAIIVIAIASCEARETEARYKALSTSGATFKEVR
jgi:hypothetical protein